MRGRRRLSILRLAAIGSLFVTVVSADETLLGCASEQKPRSTSLDPSNPTAAALPPLVATALDSGERGVSPADSVKTGEASKSDKTGRQPGIVYTCPMHPEVISDKPGRCPKCGMNLVPKEPGEGKK